MGFIYPIFTVTSNTNILPKPSIAVIDIYSTLKATGIG